MTTTEDQARRGMLEELLAGPNFAALTTLQRDGTPRTHVMWVSGTADHLRINTEVARAKARHMRNDERVSVMIWDRDAPGRFVEVVGRVTGVTEGAEARAHIDELAQKYNGTDYDESWISSPRVVFEVEPVKVFACDVTLSEERPGIWT